jgi:tRNA threonylcarbamoyladenosine biosynthesis protein TsaB
LLAFDSAGSSSTAVIWQEGVVLARAAAAGAHHSEQLLVLIEQCLADAALDLGQMDAIACGRGPGAFTGVRLALSVAQGLAFAARLRIIPVSNLQAAAERAAGLAEAPSRLLVCQDARMREVYWAAYETDAQATHLIGVEALASPLAVVWPSAWTVGVEAWGLGSGFDAYPQALQPLVQRLGRCLAIEGSAEEVARVAARLGPAQALQPEQVLPVYLRDDVVRSA